MTFKLLQLDEAVSEGEAGRGEQCESAINWFKYMITVQQMVFIITLKMDFFRFVPLLSILIKSCYYWENLINDMIISCITGLYTLCIVYRG